MKNPWSLKGWLLGLFLLAALFSAHVNAANNFWLITFDIGHCNSELFVFPDGKKMLFDAGTEEKCVTKIIPFLKYHGITQLDYVIRSHEHGDHVGGILPLQNAGIINMKTLVQDCKSFKIGDRFERSGTNWYIYNASYGGMDNRNSVSYFMNYNGFRISGSGDEEQDGKLSFVAKVNGNEGIDHSEFFPTHVRVQNHHATGNPGSLIPSFDGKLNAYIWIFPTWEGNPDVVKGVIANAQNSPRFQKIVYFDKIHVIRASSGTEWESFFLDNISSKGKFIMNTPPPPPPGPPVKLTVTASPMAIGSDGSTVAVTATLRDSLGQVTAVGNGPVTFTVTGGGTIAGASTVMPVEGSASVNVSRQPENAVQVTAVMGGSLSGSVVISGLTNLISNNSFEIPGPAGADDAAGWTRGNGHTRSSDKPHNGSWSLKSVSNGSNTSIVVPVEPGVAYIISGYIFNNSAGSAYIDMNDIPGEVSLESQKGGSDWQKVAGVWTNTSGLRSVTLRLVTDGGNTQTWFDDISFIGPGSNVVSIKDRQAEAGREFRQGDLEISPVVSFPGMNVRFVVTKRVQLDLDILDIRGKLVKRLYSKSTEPGSHSLSFNVTDLKPGLYMLRGSTSFGSAAAKKILVLK